MADPQARLIINIDGAKHASDLNITKDFDTQTSGNGKFEKSIYFTSATSPASVNFTKVGTLNTLMVKSNSSTEVITMTISIDDGVLAPYTIVIPFISFFVHNFGSTFFSYITGISFATSASAYMELDVRAYV